mmetsp:Transcript_57001/g.158713  ORF Transcript_57001/g.158713 Transcript_57001/m.158713 type:complete len:502 (-) Transcript_57001:2-1507(-)
MADAAPSVIGGMAAIAITNVAAIAIFAIHAIALGLESIARSPIVTSVVETRHLPGYSSVHGLRVAAGCWQVDRRMQVRHRSVEFLRTVGKKLDAEALLLQGRGVAIAERHLGLPGRGLERLGIDAQVGQTGLAERAELTRIRAEGLARRCGHNRLEAVVASVEVALPGEVGVVNGRHPTSELQILQQKPVHGAVHDQVGLTSRLWPDRAMPGWSALDAGAVHDARLHGQVKLCSAILAQVSRTKVGSLAGKWLIHSAVLVLVRGTGLLCLLLSFALYVFAAQGSLTLIVLGVGLRQLVHSGIVIGSGSLVVAFIGDASAVPILLQRFATPTVRIALAARELSEDRFDWRVGVCLHMRGRRWWHSNCLFGVFGHRRVAIDTSHFLEDDVPADVGTDVHAHWRRLAPPRRRSGAATARRPRYWFSVAWPLGVGCAAAMPCPNIVTANTAAFPGRTLLGLPWHELDERLGVITVGQTPQLAPYEEMRRVAPGGQHRCWEKKARS